MKRRRSIRKYLTNRVEKEKLDRILEAGIYAPNPGGKQGTKIIMLDDPELIERIGIVNANCENRNWDVGVSSEQPSIIDDKTIKSGFYGCQALGIVCVQRDRRTQINQVGAAFVCVENMVLEAYAIGISSCIVGRAEATFDKDDMQELLDIWGLDKAYTPIVFACFGYINGEYPEAKQRIDGRTIYVSDMD